MWESETILPVLPMGRSTLKSFFLGVGGGGGKYWLNSSKEVVPMAPPGSPSLGVFPKPLLNAFQLV